MKMRELHKNTFSPLIIESSPLVSGCFWFWREVRKEEKGRREREKKKIGKEKEEGGTEGEKKEKERKRKKKKEKERNYQVYGFFSLVLRTFLSVVMMFEH